MVNSILCFYGKEPTLCSKSLNMWLFKQKSVICQVGQSCRLVVGGTAWQHLALSSMLGRQKQRKRPQDEGMIQVLTSLCCWLVGRYIAIAHSTQVDCIVHQLKTKGWARTNGHLFCCACLQRTFKPQWLKPQYRHWKLPKHATCIQATSKYNTDNSVCQVWNASWVMSRQAF